MNNLILGSVCKAKDIKNACEMYRTLTIFPTPFKGIYYIPYETERKAFYITDPKKVIFEAAKLYLNSEQYYFGLFSALYYLRIIWNAQGTDIITNHMSRRINPRRVKGNYWRAHRINEIMSSYPMPIRIHRIKGFSTNGLINTSGVVFSTIEKTKTDSKYLCMKGDKCACAVNKLLQE